MCVAPYEPRRSQRSVSTVMSSTLGCAGRVDPRFALRSMSGMIAAPARIRAEPMNSGQRARQDAPGVDEYVRTRRVRLRTRHLVRVLPDLCLQLADLRLVGHQAQGPLSTVVQIIGDMSGGVEGMTPVRPRERRRAKLGNLPARSSRARRAWQTRPAKPRARLVFKRSVPFTNRRPSRDSRMRRHEPEPFISSGG